MTAARDNNAHSFIVVAYKESCHLAACVESLLNQSAPGEVVIATSTPCDHIKNIVEKYNLRYEINPVSGGGIAADWNFAAGCAQTKFYTLAHQDDIYLPEYREKVLKRASEDSVIVFSDYAEIRGKKLVRWNLLLLVKRILLSGYFLIPVWRSRFWKRRFLSFGCTISCPAVTYHRDKIADFKFDSEYKVDLDWDAWLRLADIEGTFAMSRAILMGHRIHEESETTNCIASNRRREEDGKMFRRLWPGWIAKIICKYYQWSARSNS